MDSNQLLDNENIFMYFDVQNLSIDHSLTLPEIDRYKDLIFSPNSLQQIYFKDSCDLKTIEVIKDLLTISDYVDDSRIEKFVLLKLSSEDTNSLLDGVYENPDTWQVPYEFVDDSFSLTDIPTYRTISTFINKMIDKELSPIEQIMKIYDAIKLMDYESGNNQDLIPDIIRKKRTDSFGMNKLFSYILNLLGYKTFVGKTDKGEYVTAVDVVDSKYNLDGIYLFNPSMDHLSKEDYSVESVRRINYNFFGINLDLLNRVSYDENLEGVLALLSVDNRDFSIEKVDNCKESKMVKEIECLTGSFGMEYASIYDRINSTKRIDIETILSVNDVLYKDKKENYNRLLKENYEVRKKELFNKNSSEELEEMVLEENNIK